MHELEERLLTLEPGWELFIFHTSDHFTALHRGFCCVVDSESQFILISETSKHVVAADHVKDLQPTRRTESAVREISEFFSRRRRSVLQHSLPRTASRGLRHDLEPCVGDTDNEPAVVVLGTRQGVVKRVAVQGPPTKREWDLIALDDGDEVVGAQESAPGDDIVLIASDAQVLRFSADAVRPQGRTASGMAGMRLAEGAELIACLSVASDDPDALIVTVAGSRSALPGTSAFTAKVTSLADIPRKGRGTGGVRAHRFLRFEDVLVLGWAGAGPVRACAASGAPLDLPAQLDKRDPSGTPLTGSVASVAGPPG